MIARNALMRIEDMLGPSASAWRRASTALALSAVLHFAVLYCLGAPARGAPIAERDPTLNVRLLPAENSAAMPPREATVAANEPAHEPSVQQGAAYPGPGGVIPGPRYYLSSELDRRATPLYPIEPGYPPMAESETHYVVLRIFINERGSVDRVAAVTADSEGIFEKSARAAFEKAQFAPGVRNGIPVRSQLMVEVKFGPGDKLPPGDPAAPVAGSGR